MKLDQSQIESPRASMHSELLMHVSRKDIHTTDRSAHPHFEVAAWLTLKNTEQLPALLLMEYTDSKCTRWKILDTATIRSVKGAVLLAGAIDPEVNHIQEINVFLCHPSPFVSCEISEIRFNNELIFSDYLDKFNVA